MGEPNAAATFRRQATLAYRGVCIGLAVLTIAVGGLGWRFGGTWGLIVGGLVALLIAGVGAYAATFVWAMTQDGA